jgi:hypothetical protein
MNNGVNKGLWDIFLASPPQQSAVTCIVAELERTELVMPEKTDPLVYSRFVADFVLELSLYGYCVYRRTSKGPVVLPGKYVVLNRKGPTKFVPKVINPAHKRLVGSTGWRIVVLHAPETAATGEYAHPMSAAFKCQRQAVELLRLNQQLHMRDLLNSRPSVYTRISKQIGATNNSAVPWFQSTHAGMQVDVLDQPADINDLIENRADTIRALDRITNSARAATAQTSVGGAPVEHTPVHKEHIVSDGRDIDEARHLNQDTEIIHFTVERLSHEIQFCFGCPPQVLGKNINSERMASSNRLTELALNHFRTHTRKLKQLLAQVFDILGDGVTFGHCASTHTLEQVGQFLKPKDFIDLYACAYELNTSQFDKSLVRRWQEAQTPSNKKADSEESKAKKSRERQDVSN